MTNRPAALAGNRSATLWLPLASIFFAAAVVRLSLAHHSLWFDEQASVFFSDQPYHRLWSDWILRETNPPLYYSMLKAWRVLGSSDFILRALSVLGSVMAMLALALVARRLYGASAAIIAATFAAISGQHLYFAEQARAYIFVYLCVVIAIGAITSFLASGASAKTQRVSLGTFGLASVAAIHLHSTMLLFPGLMVLAMAAANPKKPSKTSFGLPRYVRWWR